MVGFVHELGKGGVGEGGGEPEGEAHVELGGCQIQNPLDGVGDFGPPRLNAGDTARARWPEEQQHGDRTSNPHESDEIM